MGNRSEGKQADDGPVLSTDPWVRNYCYSHFSDGETEAPGEVRICKVAETHFEFSVYLILNPNIQGLYYSASLGKNTAVKAGLADPRSENTMIIVFRICFGSGSSSSVSLISGLGCQNLMLGKHTSCRYFGDKRENAIALSLDPGKICPKIFETHMNT